MKKLDRNEAIEILKTYLSKRIIRYVWFLKIKKHIKAIIFYGSTAKQTNRANSDLDLLIILPLKIEEKYTKGEYFYKYNKREINIVLRSIERLRKASLSKNSFEKEIFRESEVLFSSDDEIHHILKKI